MRRREADLCGLPKVPRRMHLRASYSSPAFRPLTSISPWLFLGYFFLIDSGRAGPTTLSGNLRALNPSVSNVVERPARAHLSELSIRQPRARDYNISPRLLPKWRGDHRGALSGRQNPRLTPLQNLARLRSMVRVRIRIRGSCR